MPKTVLITGASKGIGAETAILFAEKGYNVAMNYYRSETAAKMLCSTLAENGYNAVCVGADISKPNEVELMMQKVKSHFGKIDILINNAGIAQQKLFNDLTIDDWNKMIGVNLTGAFNCTRAVVNGMINRKYGVIINISSIWGETGGSCEVHYSAAKAGLIGFTKALAKELGPSGIRVNCITPGVISTNMNAALSVEDLNALADDTPLCRIGTAKEVANAIYMLASDEAAFITGQILGVNGGLHI